MIDFESPAHFGEEGDAASIEWTVVCYGTVTAFLSAIVLILGLAIGSFLNGALITGDIMKGVEYGTNHAVVPLLGGRVLDVAVKIFSLTLGVFVVARESRRLSGVHSLIAAVFIYVMFRALDAAELFT